MKKVFALLLISMFSVMQVYAGTLTAGAKTKRIPAGTIIGIKFLQQINTFSKSQGDSFTAVITDELVVGDSIVLPLGSAVRGSISKVKPTARFSRGAKLYLDFDHIVTPNGRQIPLDMAVCQYDNIYLDGGLYKNLGYGETVQNNFKRGVEIIKDTTQYGLNAKESAPGMQYITTPVCAIGGTFGAAGYFVGKSVTDMFKKGQEVRISEGEELKVKLLTPIDVPVH